MSRRNFFAASPPDVAIEIDAHQVAAARLVWRGAAPAVAARVAEALPAGAVVPALGALNLVDLPLVRTTLAQAVSRLGGRVTRAALVVPDLVAKVSIIKFDTVPASSADLGELVRWQVRKTAPFPIEQSVVSFTPGATPAEGGQEFVVSVARRDVVAQYEDVCAAAGITAGLVDISTFSIINGVLAGGGAPAGDWLLVHATENYSTLAVLRGDALIFFRNREDEAEGTLADVVHQTAMYYEDRLKGSGFTRVLLAGGAVRGVDAVRQSLEQRLDVRIEPVPHSDQAALIGILARERQAA